MQTGARLSQAQTSTHYCLDLAQVVRSRMQSLRKTALDSVVFADKDYLRFFLGLWQDLAVKDVVKLAVFELLNQTFILLVGVFLHAGGDGIVTFHVWSMIASE